MPPGFRFNGRPGLTLTVVAVFTLVILVVGVGYRVSAWGQRISGTVAAASPLVQPDRNPVHLAFDPLQVTQQIGDIFEVRLMAYSERQEVDGAEVYVVFDPSKLQVVDAAGNSASTVTLGGHLSLLLLNQVDNTAGLIRLAAGRLQPPYPYGSLLLANVTFQAIDATPTAGTELLFGRALPLTTQVTFAGEALETSLAPGVVLIAP